MAAGWRHRSTVLFTHNFSSTFKFSLHKTRLPLYFFSNCLTSADFRSYSIKPATENHEKFLSSPSQLALGFTMSDSSGRNWRVIIAVSTILCTSATIFWAKKKIGYCKEDEGNTGIRRSDLPDYNQETISAHNCKKTGIWVTYKEGVYDITEFVENHPGGNKIFLAAGGQLEPFWEMYAVHKNQYVYEILEEFRIGNIHPDDLKNNNIASLDDPYASDPVRHPALKVNSGKPFNAETPSELLVESFLTPNELFFTRNHLPSPKLSEDEHVLTLSRGPVSQSIKFSLEDLKKNYEPHTLTSAIQCAGNRRTHMGVNKPVRGLSWNIGAIGNAEWTGVLLSDVLQQAGVTEDSGKHVIFQGGDKDTEGVPYEASIPIEVAVDPKREVLLAYAMNGAKLPQDHGFPLRVIVPGVVGARQVKWLTNIIISQEESGSHWQQKDYKTFNPSEDWNTADFSKSVAIQDYPLQSAICEPKNGTVLTGKKFVCKGYAWSGGGRGIIRVEVSLDGGDSWHEAKLHQVPQRVNRRWSWTVWEITFPIPRSKSGETLEIVCKAVDSSHNQQPEHADAIWNMRGLVHNAWHRIKVKIPDI